MSRDDDDSYVTLKGRVDQFNALQLPGQPQSMHDGTRQLVNDLWRQLRKLREQIRDN
jgi:hypothetical protein